VTIMSNDWQAVFPRLAGSRDPALRDMLAAARAFAFDPGVVVFHTGAACSNYLLVIDGSVRVQFTTESGRDVVLYHVGAGESCVLTTSCLLGSVPYPAEGITQSAVRAIAIPATEFARGMEDSADFRAFVLENIGRRFAEVIARMTDVAFGQIDSRLARALLEASGTGRRAGTTHEALAGELGSAREVVSRHLKRFEQCGWVRLGRGRIEVLDRPALERHAARPAG
jgi:CRP/FNR family transcriptional regulator